MEGHNPFSVLDKNRSAFVIFPVFLCDYYDFAWAGRGNLGPGAPIAGAQITALPQAGWRSGSRPRGPNRQVGLEP